MQEHNVHILCTRPIEEDLVEQALLQNIRIDTISLIETEPIQSIEVQQHMRVDREGSIDELDLALEVDPAHVELVCLAFGQRVLSLNYDGKQITSWRHIMLPRQVKAEDVLEDMQLTLWPLEAIRQALPPGWQIEDRDLRRILTAGDEVVTEISYTSMPPWSGSVKLENHRLHYTLTVQTAQPQSQPQPQPQPEPQASPPATAEG